MNPRPRTAIEKIVERHLAETRPAPRAGDYVTIRPRRVMTHDNTSAVIPKFHAIAGRRGAVLDPSQPVFAMDHDIQNTTPRNLAKYASIRAFAERHGITYYPPGHGIAHQIMIERGHVVPGSFVVGSDSHANMYGAIAAVGTPVVRTDAAALWATGRTWWQVPPQIRVELTGRLAPGATGKDVILALCGRFTGGEVLNGAIEFHGGGTAGLSIDDRMTIANMTTEWGALVALFPFDAVLRSYLLERAAVLAADPDPAYTRDDVERWWADRHAIGPDPDARYARVIRLDLATVSAHVTGPNSVSRTRPVVAVERDRVRVHKAYLMSCVNARLADLDAAAAVFARQGPDARVADGVEFYVAAASREIQRRAQASGSWQRLLRAGAIELPPGCGACIGLGRGTLEPGEVGISATNRNFEGRMGSVDAACYLASPAVVAQSAIRGYIAGPAHAPPALRASCTVAPRHDPVPSRQEILPGFPHRCAGRALFLPRENLNTDGIYARDVTYRDDVSWDEQGAHAMRNYDPGFQEIAERGDILVGASNFGTGSSREQAATALSSRGIAMVVAASVSQTYQRNAFNNGLVVVECPGLVGFLADRYAGRIRDGARTIAGPDLAVDFTRSRIVCAGRSFDFCPVGAVPQRLVVAGGLGATAGRDLAAAAE